MIDARRWVIVEAWLALGLRIEWAPSYERTNRNWLQSNDEKYQYRYTGGGTWQVLDDEHWRRPGAPKPTCPQMSVSDMQHELAHYLISSPEQREMVNFGFPIDTGRTAEERIASNDREDLALEAEKVIDAVLVGANRLVESVLTPRQK